MAELTDLKRHVLALDRKLFGVEELRRAVNVLDRNSEAFNQRFTAEQLLQLIRMMSASGYDVYPDEWTTLQVEQALEGYPPQWNPYTDKPIVLRVHGPWEIDEGYEHDPRIIDAEYPEVDES